MLKLFTGRENIDKEKFLYGQVSGETLVIVPNQYTLVAEEQAIRYLDTNCLFDVEILSMNRLGLRVLTEQGLESTKMLDRYGRFMLLNRIIKRHRSELDIFSNAAGKLTFTEMINDFISEFKQQNCTLEDVKMMLSDESADELLSAKLRELEIIIEDYENSIVGKYTDSEDYVAMYVDAIKDSKIVADKTIWIYGYDSITPKFMNAMFELATTARDVNFIVNSSDFRLDKNLVESLRNEADRRGVAIEVNKISEEYAAKKSETIARIERALFNDEITDAEIAGNRDFIPEDLTLVRAANPYNEAENAAIYIYHLIRDLGFKMRDIQIIANDEGRMQPIIRRTFEEYGLPVFLDQNRSVADSAPVNFIVNQLWYLRYATKTDALMTMLKTGLAGVEREAVEYLENYARTYHIKATMWNRPFKYGAEVYGDKFAELEELRQRVIQPLIELENLAQGSVGEFVVKYKAFLEKEYSFSERVSELANEQERQGRHEDAARMVESYRAALELLDQVVVIMGDEIFDIEEFTEILTVGLSNAEVGIIPATADGLSIGTMIRTRPRAARAVVVLGANEGVLPLQPSTEGLFSVEEKSFFIDRGFALGSLDDIKMDEENVAMYRLLSLSSEKLYISYSMTDAAGEEMSPSPLIDSLNDLFPRIEKDGRIIKDLISEGWSSEIISSERTAMRHLFNHIKGKEVGSELDQLSDSLMVWFEHRNEKEFDEMLKAVQYENDPSKLGNKTAKGLFAGADGSFKLSASSIGSYFDCPFKYYIGRGLRPEEEREFSSDARSIGDVYHRCLMNIAEKIIKDSAYAERILSCDTDDLESIVGEELDIIAADYKEGLLESSDAEEYRLSRIKEICAVAARAMAVQLTAESITDARFEEGFGRGRKLKPVELQINGDKFYIEGQIDRADIMGDRIRIVDYKTGNDKLEVNKMAQGYKMQLMIYMMAAMQDGYEPAGMFYFNIADPMMSFNDVNENYSTGGESFKLRGEYVNDEGILESMPPEVLANSKSKGVSHEQFDALKSAVETNISGIAEKIANGEIGIHPFKENNKLVCNYCDYRSICRRDRSYVKNYGKELAKVSKEKK